MSGDGTAAAGRWRHNDCEGTVTFDISGGWCGVCEAEQLGEGDYTWEPVIGRVRLTAEGAAVTAPDGTAAGLEVTHDPEVPVHLVLLHLCEPCLNGEGGQCHTPGCALWINRAPDLPLRDSPFVTVIDVEADVRPREGERGWHDVKCGACGGEFGTNFAIDQIECAECEARRCPKCATWFGGDEQDDD